VLACRPGASTSATCSPAPRLAKKSREDWPWRQYPNETLVMRMPGALAALALRGDSSGVGEDLEDALRASQCTWTLCHSSPSAMMAFEEPLEQQYERRERT